MFERLENTVHELKEDVDCLGGIKRIGEPTQEKNSLLFHYLFDPEQDTKISEGSKVKFVPDLDIIATVSRFHPEGELVIKISRKQLEKCQRESLPEYTSIIPFEYVSADVIVNAIFSIVNTYHETGELPYALEDFLYRKPSRLKSGHKGPLVRRGESTIHAAIRLAKDLDNNCLWIHGPPGTGKTYTAGHMIAALLTNGKNIGITSNSHKAIMNLMRAVCKQSPNIVRGIKVGGDWDDPLFEAYPGIEHVSSSGAAADEYKGGLIGGTAWLFSREDMRERLDYLFVEEAGQMSVANLFGMARSTRNIIPLGDQMQLGQPIQGTHPGESGQSILEYYLQAHATIAPGQGIFLETTWRMHPDVRSFLSDAVYEGRLLPEPHTQDRIMKVSPDRECIISLEAGILFIPVEHEGNMQGSDEEVAVICHIVHDLLERTFIDKEGKPYLPVIIERDMLFVTPYNLQARKLRRSPGEGARIASVDKFQGQEASIVIISLCASPGEFEGRGMKFVLNKNRLNVAISRAQSLAIVVGDPRPVETNCSTIDDMIRLNLYSWLQDVGGQIPIKMK